MFDRVHCEQKQAADRIKHILAEYQQLLVVLFRRHHGVQDKSVGCRSYKSDDCNSALRVETSTT